MGHVMGHATSELSHHLNSKLCDKINIKLSSFIPKLTTVVLGVHYEILNSN